MERWIILFKLITVIYCCSKFVQSPVDDMASIVLPILIYVFLGMLHYILKPAVCKVLLAVLSAILLIYCCIYENVLFVFLLPSIGMDVIYAVTGNLRFSPLIFLPLAVMPVQIIPEYILVACLGMLVYFLAYGAHMKVAGLSAQNDELREKVENLYGKLSKDEEFMKQIAYLSQLEERNSIAQQIHDKVGHTISASIIQLEAARLLIDKDRERAKGMMENAIAAMRQGMESIRSTLKNIKPPAEQLGINRIKSILNEFSVNSGIKTSLVYTGALDRISQMQWKVIADNLTEALTNAIKHSKCSRVSASIDVLNKVIKAEVKDDGVGTASIKKGLGLKGMEERAASIGGQVVIDGSKGFSVITLLPIEGVENEHQGADSR